MKASQGSNPAEYRDSFWSSKLMPAVLNSAVDVRDVVQALSASPDDAKQKYGHAEGTGTTYLIVKGNGRVLKVDKHSRNGLILVDIAPFDGRPDVSIQIGPVLRGSSLRDATGLVRFTDFNNQLEFADVSNNLNDRVLRSVLAPVSNTIAPGQFVSFVGTSALEDGVEPPIRNLVPIQLSVESRQ